MLIGALIASLAAGLVAPLVHRLAGPPAPSGSLERVTIASPALQRDVAALVYLPPGYRASHRRYPVLYLLHGVPGSAPALAAELDLKAQLDALIDSGSVKATIVVAPSDGPSVDADTEWMDSRVVASQRWGTFLSTDLVAFTDGHYAACTNRAARAIGGVSMGAFGATNAALGHLSEYGALLSWSGYFIANTPLVDGPAGSPQWRADSPLYSLGSHLGALHAEPLRISMYVSSDDEFLPQTLEFVRLLGAEHIVHRFTLYPGGHDPALWAAQLAEQMRWLSSGERC